MWMWAALLGINITSWLQALTGHDEEDGRAHGKRLRRELVCIAARVTNHAGRFEVHTSREDHHGLFGDAWRTLDVLLAAPSSTGPAASTCSGACPTATMLPLRNRSSD